MLNKLQIVSVKAAEVFAAIYTVRPKLLHWTYKVNLFGSNCTKLNQIRPILNQSVPNSTIFDKIIQSHDELNSFEDTMLKVHLYNES